MNLSFKNLFFSLASVIALFAILALAKTILIPLGLAMLISFILFPLAKKFESWGMNKILAAFLSILAMILIAGGGIYFLSTQIIELSKALTDFREKISSLFTDVIVYINSNVSFISNLDRNVLLDQIKEWLKSSAGTLAGKTFSSTATFLTQLLATIIYTFLILIYRNGFTQAFMKFAPKGKRKRVLNMFKNVQQVGQKYLSGMIMLIIILGLLNSIGLWIIGIDSPFLFGFLAASLAIIPYIGTIIGAGIPVLYAFMSHDSFWVPLAVIALFWSVQLVESNYLSPKIVGSNLQVNALAAILSLIIGGLMWGVAGMILFLPFAAMLKVICEEYEELRPIGLLIGNQNSRGNEASGINISNWIGKIKARFSKSQKPLKKVKRPSRNTSNLKD
jgi:predicted PurR-regulated permease PerM